MADRLLVIKDCLACPNRGEVNAPDGMKRPVCAKGIARELPFEVVIGWRSKPSARLKDGIPKWCPLPLT